ncbi:DUF6059 family protein [Kitasatospora phosalacinea]|uniref:DUF6059 family protein n=1 Tax=Kitasatospora phosalacinea TaxID=2065 RepID=UPI003667E1B1
MWRILRAVLRRTIVALGWLGLFYSPTLHTVWLPGQEFSPAPEEPPAGPPPGHPDRQGVVRLSREENRVWAELNERLVK